VDKSLLLNSAYDTCINHIQVPGNLINMESDIDMHGKLSVFETKKKTKQMSPGITHTGTLMLMKIGSKQLDQLICIILLLT
jgi:hypothetical protein